MQCPERIAGAGPEGLSISQDDELIIYNADGFELVYSVGFSESIIKNHVFGTRPPKNLPTRTHMANFQYIR